MAANVSELTNLPVEVELAGKKHQFKRLSISMLFGRFEKLVHDEWLLRVREVADTLSPEERTDYLAKVTNNPPDEKQMASLVRAKMNSSGGTDVILGLAHVAEDVDDVLPPVADLILSEKDQQSLKMLMDGLTPATKKGSSTESPLA